jgi:hypothetical protein
MKDTKYCEGCRDNFYNGNNTLDIKECWHLAHARVVTRYRIDWWTRPTEPGAFRKVKTYSCHSAPGVYADYKELPESAARD